MIVRGTLSPVLAVVTAMLLAGCGGLRRDTPGPAVYRLFAPELAAGEPVPVELRVDRPGAAAGLAGDRVASLWPDGRIDYYRDARWGEELPLVVEGALVEALARSGRLRAVQGDRAPFAPTHVLHVDIRRFEADYSSGAPPVVRVHLAATIGRAGDRKVLATFNAGAETPAGADTQTAVLRAFNVAFGRAADELCASLLTAVRVAPVLPPASE
jgi:ABC-type uncharacterized transport system auxiliary subunit